MTVSDNWFVFNVDSVYCTVCLCWPHLYVMCVSCLLKTVLLSLQATHFLAQWECYPFFRAWGNTTHSQNELKETLIESCKHYSLFTLANFVDDRNFRRPAGTPMHARRIGVSDLCDVWTDCLSSVTCGRSVWPAWHVDGVSDQCDVWMECLSSVTCGRSVWPVWCVDGVSELCDVWMECLTSVTCGWSVWALWRVDGVSGQCDVRMECLTCVTCGWSVWPVWRVDGVSDLCDVWMECLTSVMCGRSVWAVWCVDGVSDQCDVWMERSEEHTSELQSR